MHDDGTRIGADDFCNLITDRNGHVPPTLGPRADAASSPDFGVLMEAFVGTFRHRTEAVRD